MCLPLSVTLLCPGNRCSVGQTLLGKECQVFGLFCLVPKFSQTTDSSQPRPALGWMPVVALLLSV